VNGAPLRVGLTGGIASGKSAAAQRFGELGVPIIDADVSSRRVVAPGSPGLAQIVGQFGSAVLSSSGELDRAALRNLIFNDPLQRRALEAILHPLIRKDMDEQASAVRYPYMVLVIPLLVESADPRKRVDRILVVDATEEAQIERLKSRDGGSEQQARAILTAQASRTARLAAADDVLPNTGSIEELRTRVDALHQQYLQMAASGPRNPN
jgi:dephospho-CoA kinase